MSARIRGSRGIRSRCRRVKGHISGRPVQMAAGRADMAMVGAAAAADDPQLRQKARKLGVKRSELRRVAIVQFRCLVQLGVAQA